jgi:hypothetical protein
MCVCIQKKIEIFIWFPFFLEREISLLQQRQQRQAQKSN